jgi:hypothetical protein
MEKNNLILLVFNALLFSFLPTASLANTDTSPLFGENSRWSIDLATRVMRNTDKNHNTFMHTVGLDIHKVFSSSTSDIGTLMFQPYVVKLNNANNIPFFFDDGNDTQLIWRITNFNYTGLSQGKFNMRIGHFEIPFGLEYQVDTNGTLRQLTSNDRGLKADWGVSLNGIMPSFEYEVALTRGSGNEITSKYNPHVFSGRIGTLANRNLVMGLSWFTGDVLRKNGITERQKVGVDVSYYYYQWQFMAEFSVGQTAQNDTVNGFVEALWTNAKENIKTYIQLGYQSSEINSEVSNKANSTSYWVIGAQWLSYSGFDVSAQYKHKLEDTPSIDIDPILSVQLRYRM